jgi:hypothetical protein
MKELGFQCVKANKKSKCLKNYHQHVSFKIEVIYIKKNL